MSSLFFATVAASVSLNLGAVAAEWIRPESTRANAAFVVRKEFDLGYGVTHLFKAELSVSAAGIAVWRLNGHRIGDDRYEPAVSYYERRLFIRKYDVTPLLRDHNVLEAEVGGGWWEQNLAWACENGGQGLSYGAPAVWGMLVCTDRCNVDPSVIRTDSTWTARPSPIVWNNIYGGEIRDDRGGTAADGKVVVAKDVTGRLMPCPIPPCRVLGRFPVQRKTCALGEKGDAWIFDFGTNIAGTVAFRLPPLVPGSRLRVRLAETVTKEGFLDPRSEGADAMHHAPEYVYIAPEKPVAAEWTPEFSYTSFRYAEISGFEPFPDKAADWGKCPPDDLVTAVMIATELEELGKAESDDPMLRKFIAIADHTIRCNFHGLPEDCPGREKGGWLGDAQLVAPYAMRRWNLDAMYEKFMDDLADGTDIFGAIPAQVPTHRAFSWPPAPALWRAAAVTIPYHLWKLRGRDAAARKHWPLVRKCLEAFAREAENGLVRKGYGDWLPPVTKDAEGRELRMPVAHSSSLCWIECLRMADEMAKGLGLPAEADDARRAETVAKRFVEEFYDKSNHTYGYDGSDAVALSLGVYPENEKEALLSALLARLERRGYPMTTGIYSSPHLAKALVESGHWNELMKVFFNPNSPSCRTIIDDGHTTVPERLSSRLQVGRSEKGQSSLSHPMHCGWLRILFDSAGLFPRN